MNLTKNQRYWAAGGVVALAFIAWCGVNRKKVAGVIRAWNDPGQPPEGLGAQWGHDCKPLPSYDLNAATQERTAGYKIRRTYAPNRLLDPASFVLGLEPYNRVDIY